MERGLAMRILSVGPSVCLSVRPSVRLTRALWQNERKIVQIFIPYEIPFSLVFWEKEWLVGSDPEILGQPARVGAKSPILNR